MKNIFYLPYGLPSKLSSIRRKCIFLVLLFLANDALPITFEGTVTASHEPGQVVQNASVILFEVEIVGNDTLRMGVDSTFTNELGKFSFQIKTSVNSTAQKTPETFELLGNYPNPFSNQTNILLNTHQVGILKTTIYNLLGQRVASYEQEVNPGSHMIIWNGASIPGIYFAKIQLNDRVTSLKILQLTSTADNSAIQIKSNGINYLKKSRARLNLLLSEKYQIIVRKINFENYYSPVMSGDSNNLNVVLQKIIDFEAVIGSSGGSITVSNSTSELKGLGLLIPEAALSGNVKIQISQGDPDLTTGISRGEFLGPVIELSPRGTAFDSLVTLSIPYDPNLTNGDDNIFVMTYDDSTDSWGIIPSLTDTVNKRVIANITHFSIYTMKLWGYFPDNKPINWIITSYPENKGSYTDIQVHDAVTRAFANWETELSKILISFNEISDVKSADIVIEWRNLKLFDIIGMHLPWSYESYTWNHLFRKNFNQEYITCYDALAYGTSKYFKLFWAATPEDQDTHSGNAVDVEELITHEVGHALGLTHIGSGSSPPVMALKSSVNNSVHQLDPHDIYAIRRKYGIQIHKTGTVTDIDGNVYKTVKIGDQWWMAENLKVTRYRNGDSIPHITDKWAWTNLTMGAYCDYGNNTENIVAYGRLYNGYAVNDSRNIAPLGWHVPNEEEWNQLEMYLGMSQSETDNTGYIGTNEGGKLKEVGTAHWHRPNTGATNRSGFSALPGGVRGDESGDFVNLGWKAVFWSSTKSGSTGEWLRILVWDHSEVNRSASSKREGLSVRCVKD